MVCLGNICRSPIAEGVMQEKINQHHLDWTVDSAGTESFHVGEAPHRFSQKVCANHGIDISHQRARRFIKADFKNYDKIYAMAKDVYYEIENIGSFNGDMSKVVLFLNELKPDSNESVPDPYYGGEAGFEPVYELIDQTCDAIVQRYAVPDTIDS
ncbi:low molecular weight phosphotyrosine protein phosphatase [Taibaiella soli]|uniref:protein-tyrosine-phosphatase n=2 Tax=Taibaiella soli TaxID=1649169 RepID=A0A2W2BG74_9BACT|nr:low molecular weight phosphotyrosine protein phosphatase [Taibaiella soli]